MNVLHSLALAKPYCYAVGPASQPVAEDDLDEAEAQAEQMAIRAVVAAST